MASARIHEAIIKEVNKDYKMDDTLLRIGSVMPDCWRNVKEGIKDRYLTHFWDFRIKDGQANNYDEFYFKYYNELISDQYWKTYIDPKYNMEVNGVSGFKLKDGSFHKDENWFGYFDSLKLQKNWLKNII